MEAASEKESGRGLARYEPDCDWLFQVFDKETGGSVAEKGECILSLSALFTGLYPGLSPALKESDMSEMKDKILFDVRQVLCFASNRSGLLQESDAWHYTSTSCFVKLQYDMTLIPLVPVFQPRGWNACWLNYFLH